MLRHALAVARATGGTTWHCCCGEELLPTGGRGGGFSWTRIDHSRGPQDECASTGQSMEALGLLFELQAPASLQWTEKVLFLFFFFIGKPCLSQCPSQGVVW